MEKDLGDYRKSYNKGELLLENSPEEPMLLFKMWFDEVDVLFPLQETNAMTISTLGIDGYPKSRVVLLKKFTDEGFIFYTNYESEKGKAIQNNPKVCLSFFWAEAERQVIIKGEASKISKADSNAYFNSRPRGSQLGALTSNQSKIITNRAVLETKLKNLEKQHIDNTIIRPEFWGGYIIKASEIEFWQGRSNRLHDRIVYKRKHLNSWTKSRLSP